MLKSEDLFFKCGIVSVLLLTVSFIGFTGKFLMNVDKNKPGKTLNQFYDPDHGLNMTVICVLANDAYRIHYNDTVCCNRTLVHWHLPWVRMDMWKKFWKRAEKKRLQRVQKLQKAEAVVEATTATSPNETDHILPSTSEIPKTEKPQGDKLKQKPSEVLYTVLVGLVFVSAMGACWEVFKSKMKKDEGGGQGAGVRGQDKECSLAEFTMNRHLRRESQQQQHHNHGNAHLTRQASFDMPAKVTQTLIHQSSLDRAFTKPISEEDFDQMRRNSMPSSTMSERSSGISSMTLSGRTPLRTFHKQQSLDVTFEDTRKKPRHFIRRH